MTFQDPAQVLRYIEDGKIARPDLILLDINMPEMDGWEFLYHLEQLDTRTEVMLLSSSVHTEDVERSEAHKLVKCFIGKPLTEEKICRYIIHKDFSRLELD